MRLLILGGTVFLGRHVVDAALARGHDVTTFTRGRSGTPPAGVTALHGDRDGDLAALDGGRWDAVIDTSGYVPRVVAAGAELLAGAGVGHYIFVSSISAYASLAEPGVAEDAPLAVAPHDHGEDVPAHYGALKAGCERVVAERFPGRALAARLGLIVGPHDPTGRFTYWVDRLARGGEVLAPAPPGQPCQLIDGRDAGAYLVLAAERGIVGARNVTGPARPLRDVLAEIAAAVGSDAPRLTWVGEALLRDAGVAPWSDLPLWLATGEQPQLRGMLDVDASRAAADGLRPRPLADTARATLAWSRARPDAPLTGTTAMPGAAPGLTPEREAELLSRAARAR